MRDREQFRGAKLLSVAALAILLAGAVSILVAPTPKVSSTGGKPLHLPTQAKSSQPPSGTSRAPIRMGTTLVRMELVHKVGPRYPARAQAAGVQGLVLLEARIDKNGAIANLRILSGHPLLNDAAIEAVRQWRYSPVLLNEQPIDTITTIAVSLRPGQ